MHLHTALAYLHDWPADMQVLGSPGMRFDVGKFAWLGRINANIEVEQTWFTSPVKTLEDPKTHEIALAGTGPDSSSAVFPPILNDMLGTKFKVVAGYEGVNLDGVGGRKRHRPGAGG